MNTPAEYVLTMQYFTFHYGSIQIAYADIPVTKNKVLHSTMVLFKSNTPAEYVLTMQ